MWQQNPPSRRYYEEKSPALRDSGAGGVKIKAGSFSTAQSATDERDVLARAMF